MRKQKLVQWKSTASCTACMLVTSYKCPTATRSTHTWHLLEVLRPETAFLQHLADEWSALQVCQHISRTQTSQNCCAHRCLANLYPTAQSSSESLLQCSLGCTLKNMSIAAGCTCPNLGRECPLPTLADI